MSNTIPAADNSLSWFALQTKPRQEPRAHENLVAWRVETLFPQTRVRGGRASGGRERIEPLFPGYLFARFDPALQLGKVRYTRGVHRILSTGETPSIVDDAIIEAIRGRIEKDGYVRHGARFVRGDRVRIASGPFADFEGVFESEDAADRIRLLVAAIHGQVRVVIDRALVEEVNAIAGARLARTV